jgi:DUF1680 family protein
MSRNPALREQTHRIVSELIKTQADDGYLGPFPKSQRLKANWDLWGHYHCMLALLMWNEETGDPAALHACRRVANLICDTFLDTGLRVRDAGSPEMNMAVIHGLGVLYRRAPDPRYLAMMREIEKDWETAGDYLRTGLAGTPFYKTPRPRWESLHDLQGLVELYRITGDNRYRTAFESQWRTIEQYDRHNTGAFSTGEGAIGDPYAPGAIETCCTVAWMAITADMLRLTENSKAADELELSTWNAAAGAQHPSGAWWTYDTPMDGARVPSFKAIAFQARPDTPGLNCCSVNGPRSLGMISEWAVMTTKTGLVVNFYAPGSFTGTLRDGTPVSLRWETRYPLDGHVRLIIESDAQRAYPIRVRIPAWSATTPLTVAAGGRTETRNVPGGMYAATTKKWRRGDTIDLDFDMRLRAVPGAREMAGHVSIYRGPLLLAYEARRSGAEGSAPPSVRAHDIAGREARAVPAADGAGWLHVDLPTADGHTVRLYDFASAGEAGAVYHSWLPAVDWAVAGQTRLTPARAIVHTPQ